MDNKKFEIKKALKKMLEIQSLLVVITLAGVLTYYTKCFYLNETLVFTVKDTKILSAMLFMILWLVLFGYYFWRDNKRLLKIIISKSDLILEKNGKIENQNEVIQNQNEIIQDLLKQVLQHNENIESDTKKIAENTEDILEQGDYIVERNEEMHIENIKSNRNLYELSLLDGSEDNIA